MSRTADEFTALGYIVDENPKFIPLARRNPPLDWMDYPKEMRALGEFLFWDMHNRPIEHSEVDSLTAGGPGSGSRIDPQDRVVMIVEDVRPITASGSSMGTMSTLGHTATFSVETLTSFDTCVPCQQEDDELTAAAPVLDEEDDEKGASKKKSGCKWAGIIGVEGEMTGDGRFIELNALTWGSLPIPLRYVSSDVGAHSGAQVVGQITDIERREGGVIWAEGFFDSSEVGQEAQRQVAEGMTTGVSMDLDQVSFEVRVSSEMVNEAMAQAAAMNGEAEALALPDADSEGRVTITKKAADSEVNVTTAGRVRAATIVAIPAFDSARIALAEDGEEFGWSPSQPRAANGRWGDGSPAKGGVEGGEDVGGSVNIGEIPEGGGSPDDEERGYWMGVRDGQEVKQKVKDEKKTLEASAFDPPTTFDALVASSIPHNPPAAWFSNPRLDKPTALTVTKEGRVYGHLAQWGTCHVSHSHSGCVTAPKSNTNYAYFKMGAVLTEEGSEVAVGHITLDTRHAGGTLGPAQAAAHYDNTGSVVADVAAGEDSHGIWVAGALRPNASEDQIRALRSAPLSGDWRRVNGNLELVAALAVNVPGFPIPRPAGMVASGAVQALVASGILPPTKVLPPEHPESFLSSDDIRYLKQLAAREQADEVARVRGAGESLASRVRATTLALRMNAVRDLPKEN